MKPSNPISYDDTNTVASISQLTTPCRQHVQGSSLRMNFTVPRPPAYTGSPHVIPAISPSSPEVPSSPFRPRTYTISALASMLPGDGEEDDNSFDTLVQDDRASGVGSGIVKSYTQQISDTLG